MRFIDILELINIAVDKGLIHSEDNKVAIYRSGPNNGPDGWYLESRIDLATELVNNKIARDDFISRLKEVGINLDSYNKNS